MKEFGKKDLRTGYRMTVKWKSLGEQQYLVLLNTENGDIISGEGGWDELNDDLSFHSGIVLKIERPTKRNVFNAEYETIYERTEKLPYGAWYSADDFGGLLFYTDERKGFGFKANGCWFESDKLMALNCGNMKPVPTKEWQARLIDYAEEKGYKNGNYKCLSGYETHIIDSNEFFIYGLGVWNGNKLSPSNLILDLKTGKWAEIIEPDQVVLVCHTQCVMLDDESETLTVGKEYPVKIENNIYYVIIDDDGHYHHFPKEADSDCDSFKKWFYIKGEKEELHSDLSTNQLIQIIKKRTGANHVQILIDKQ